MYLQALKQILQAGVVGAFAVLAIIGLIALVRVMLKERREKDALYDRLITKSEEWQSRYYELALQMDATIAMILSEHELEPEPDEEEDPT